MGWSLWRRTSFVGPGPSGCLESFHVHPPLFACDVLQQWCALGLSFSLFRFDTSLRSPECVSKRKSCIPPSLRLLSKAARQNQPSRMANCWVWATLKTMQLMKTVPIGCQQESFVRPLSPRKGLNSSFALNSAERGTWMIHFCLGVLHIPVGDFK